MKRFIQWREKAHGKELVHPIACQLCAYFLPFPDGNGSVGRLVMQDYLVRQGYSPVSFIGGVERPDLRTASRESLWPQPLVLAN